jgi:flagellar assembly protein FliH
MVLKTKSEETIKPLKNVSDFTDWALPPLDSNGSSSFRQEDRLSDKEKAELLEKRKQEELEKIRKAAYQEGLNSGLAEAKQIIDEKQQLLDSLIFQLTEPLKLCGDKTTGQLLELSFSIARQIVRRELQQEPTQLIAIIREAINLLPAASQKTTISLHPEDAKVVRDALSIDLDAENSRWKIHEDLSIERGGCQVNTKQSRVDASIDKQIAILFSRVAGGQREKDTELELDVKNNNGHDSSSSVMPSNNIENNNSENNNLGDNNFGDKNLDDNNSGDNDLGNNTIGDDHADG